MELTFDDQDEADLTHAPPRARSSLRQRYEAEAILIEKRRGSLEQIRLQLGLSQRKIAQLLLVDPSAWTRWTQSGSGAPPHVWRALSWYLDLQDRRLMLSTPVEKHSEQVFGIREHIREIEERTMPPVALPSDSEAAETRAMANFFLALSFTALGLLLGHYFL